MNARDYILLEYAHLSDGEARAGELCPACNGGETKERTLSVSKQAGGLLWLCHRASCGFRGRDNNPGASHYSGTSPVRTRGHAGRQYIRDAEQVPDDVREELRVRYSISDADIARHGIGWAAHEGRLVLPVKSMDGDELGAALRSLRNVQPKTKTHTEDGAIAWYRNAKASGVIIVEDQFSAIRSVKYMNAVALLGTHMNDERVAEIKASGCRPVFLALDADAWDKTIRYVVNYRSMLRMNPVKLTEDIKDLSEEEARHLFNMLHTPDNIT